MIKAEISKEAECHCGHIAHKYRTRTFVSQMGHTTYRTFYRCENCWSRIHLDTCPEIDAMPKVNVYDLLNNADAKSKLKQF